MGVAVGVVFAYLMVGIRLGRWEERTHLIAYGIVAALIHQALLERVRSSAVAVGATLKTYPASLSLIGC